MEPVLPDTGTMMLHMRNGDKIDTTALRDTLRVSHEGRTVKRDYYIHEKCSDCKLDSLRKWVHTAILMTDDHCPRGMTLDKATSTFHAPYDKSTCPECTRAPATQTYVETIAARQREAEEKAKSASQKPPMTDISPDGSLRTRLPPISVDYKPVMAADTPPTPRPGRGKLFAASSRRKRAPRSFATN